VVSDAVLASRSEQKKSRFRAANGMQKKTTGNDSYETSHISLISPLSLVSLKATSREEERRRAARSKRTPEATRAAVQFQKHR